MSKTFDELCAVIAGQQAGKENTDVFMVGEQLKDIAAEIRICRFRRQL